MASDLRQRVVTALVLLLVLVAATSLLSPFLFALFAALVVLMGGWEWAGFVQLNLRRSKLGFMATLTVGLAGLFLLLGVTPESQSVDGFRVAMLLWLGLFFWVLAFLMLWGYPASAYLWNDKSRIALMGLCAMLPTWVGLVQLKYLQTDGLLVMALVVMVAAVDVGAYFFGIALGHTKLAPNLSPNKSWEGVWGGLLTCFALGVLLVWALDQYLVPLDRPQQLTLVLLSLSVTFFCVIGDLVESMLKRNCQLKDSGSLLPGHGGLLDRVDGLMAVTPAFVLTLLLTLTDLE